MLTRRALGSGFAVALATGATGPSRAAPGSRKDIQSGLHQLGPGDGLLQLEATTYDIDAPIALPPNMPIRGVPGQTIVKVAGDDMAAFAKHGGERAGGT